MPTKLQPTTLFTQSASRQTPRRNLQLAVLAAVCIAVLSISQETEASSQAEQVLPLGKLVAIELTTGREVHGRLAKESDRNFLWIEREEQGIFLSSQFPQSKVVSWRILQDPTNNVSSESKDGHKGSELVNKSQNNAIQDTGPPIIAEPLPCPVASRTSSAVASRTSNPIASRTSNRVASLRIHATVANWDADAEVDGIEVLVQPVDHWGNVVPIRGQIDFQLLGQRSPWDRTAPTRNGRKSPPRFDTLEDWSRTVSSSPMRSTQVTPDGVVFRLDFRNFHPDRDLEVSIESVLHARLGVPGQGLFEASSDAILLRPINFLRDDLQLQTGSRYFKQERFPQ